MFGEEIYYIRSFNAAVHSIITVCTIVTHFCMRNLGIKWFDLQIEDKRKREREFVFVEFC